ncbi:MAG: acyltransferase [Gemmatimonadota bacterium]
MTSPSAPPTISQAPPIRDHLPALDSLRGLAVLLVLWHHLPDDLFGPLAAAVGFAIRPGYLGVDIFFVLSGFLITRILLFDRARGASLGTFFKRRFARIFPVYYLTLLVVGLWQPGSYILWAALDLCNFYYAVEKTPFPRWSTLGRSPWRSISTWAGPSSCTR